MTPSTSLFLDLLRILAAAAVFGVHGVLFWAPAHSHGALYVAHTAVMVFFVLSGYVIAFSTLGRTRDARGYMLARLSRLYSVLAPALVLTACLQWLGHRLDPGFAQFQSRGSDVFRYLAVAGYLQNIWVFSASPPANGPFWSLSYEFWYYAIFGAVVLLPAGRWRVAGVLGTMLVAGPSILLLLPCWLVGVAVYLFRCRADDRWLFGRIGLALSVVAAGAVVWLVPETPRLTGQPPLNFSSSFLSDWVLAATVGLVIWFFDVARFPGPAWRLERSVRWAAGHTFSLYLFHFPLLAFVTVWWSMRQPPAWQVAAATAVTLFCIWLLSTLAEAKRSAWRAGFAKVWDGAVRLRRSLGQRPGDSGLCVE